VWVEGLDNINDGFIFLESQKPFFAELSQPASFILGQTNELECDAVGLPKPSIEWQKDGEVRNCLHQLISIL
jgi:hypothetical protein